MKFVVFEKAVKLLMGAQYDLAKFVEGVDYRRVKIRVGTRVMFRSNILEDLVERGVLEQRAELPAETVRQSEQPVQRAAEAIVTQRYPNPRYVNTTVGRVFVGGKPVKLGQRIQVCEGKLVIKAASYLG